MSAIGFFGRVTAPPALTAHMSPSFANMSHTNSPPSMTPSTRGFDGPVAHVFAFGGTPPYSISWHHSGSSGVSFSQGSAGQWAVQHSAIAPIDTPTVLVGQSMCTVVDSGTPTQSATAMHESHFHYRSGF